MLLSYSTSSGPVRLSTIFKVITGAVSYMQSYEFLVSKETVVLPRWERSKQKFGFIKRVAKG